MGPTWRHRRSVKADTSFSVWLNTIGCVDYKPQLLAMGYRNTDDLFDLQDETDDFIRSKFSSSARRRRLISRSSSKRSCDRHRMDDSRFKHSSRGLGSLDSSF